LIEQWTAGTHTTLESVKGFTCFAVVFFLAAGLVGLPPVALLVGAGAFEDASPFAGVPPPEGALVPPTVGDAAAPSPGWRSAEQSRQSASSATLTAMEVDRL
jgi:hypothetical protein